MPAVQPIRLVGGSLSTVESYGGWIKKSYCGDIRRGHDKLLQEENWLRLTRQQLGDGSKIFIPRTQIVSRGACTSIMVEQCEGITATKALLSGYSPRLVAEKVSDFLDCMVRELYPLRREVGDDSQSALHIDERLALTMPSLEGVLGSLGLSRRDRISVNGAQPVALDELIAFIISQRHLLPGSPAIAMHGNLHLDNILNFTSGDRPVIIDPRGNLLGPMWYDPAKFMSSLWGCYDLIHYGKFALQQTGPRRYTIAFDGDARKTYEAVYDALADSPGYVSLLEASGTSDAALRIAELLHTLSFIFYHWNKTEKPLARCQAFLLFSFVRASELMGSVAVTAGV